jgi:methylenetetrahydrofolate dehydrogenase (NADP+)/methenyltetrahydrofolate cyclohydrolase
MVLIDGKGIAEIIKKEIRAEVADMIDKKLAIPHLAAVLIGNDPASETYIRNKEKACKEVGIISSIYRYPSSVSKEELLDIIDFINNDDEIHGLIVQTPLPAHIQGKKIIESINPAKDVDGFHPANAGRMILGLPAYLPATPYGIMQLLERYKIQTEGKRCVVLGRSHNVGTPIGILLSRKAYPGNCTVTICHTLTQDIPSITMKADILIAAMGQAEFVKADMVRKGAVVIDVGIHRIKSAKSKTGFRITGDVKFDEVSKKASHITPVPGGVGPMTVVSLLKNTVKAARKEVYG